MFNSGIEIHDIVVNHVRAMRSRWARLEPAECANIRTVGELVAAVESRYRFSAGRASQDVQIWLKEAGTPKALIRPDERIVREMITFEEPFFIEGLGRQYDPGTFELEIVEEQIEGLSFLAFRTVSTSIVLPRSKGSPQSYKVARIDPEIVRAARQASAARMAGPSDYQGEIT